MLLQPTKSHIEENISLDKFYLIIILMAFSVSNIAQTNVPTGNVSGTLTKADSPYYILGEITIPNDSILTIESGVDVVFKGHYKFNVQGKLIAIGTQQDSIHFTAENTKEGWHGVRFFNTPNTNDTSKFFFCSFKYGNANTGSNFDRCGGAMLIKDFNKVLVSNCLFDSNYQSGDQASSGWDPPTAAGGIYVYQASPTITNNTFSNNISDDKSSAVTCVNCPNVSVKNNIFIGNTGRFAPLAYVSNSKGTISGNIILFNFATETAGGILVDCVLSGGKVSPRIENNIIIHNHAPVGGGISCIVNGDPILVNNTIAFNGADKGGGIFCSNSHPILINNILYENSATLYGEQVYINDIYEHKSKSELIFQYCDVQGGKEKFGGTGAGSNFKGIYENNIDVDPEFLNVAEDDYRLSDISQCINAGVDSIEINRIMYNCPAVCINGNPRPSPVNSYPDIGACENPLGTFVHVEKLIKSNKFELSQNYPNPFNPSTTIKYSIPKDSRYETLPIGRQVKDVRLKIYDILGKEVKTLINKQHKSGNYEVEFDGSSLPSGVYFYKLTTGSFSQTKKMILLR